MSVPVAPIAPPAPACLPNEVNSSIPTPPPLPPPPAADIKAPIAAPEKSVEASKFNRFSLYVKEKSPRIYMFAQSIFSILLTIPYTVGTLANSAWTVTRGAGNLIAFVFTGLTPFNLSETKEKAVHYGEKTIRALFIGAISCVGTIFSPTRAEEFYNKYGSHNVKEIAVAVKEEINQEEVKPKKEKKKLKTPGKVVASAAVSALVITAPGSEPKKPKHPPAEVELQKLRTAPAGLLEAIRSSPLNQEKRTSTKTIDKQLQDSKPAPVKVITDVQKSAKDRSAPAAAIASLGKAKDDSANAENMLTELTRKLKLEQANPDKDDARVKKIEDGIKKATLKRNEAEETRKALLAGLPTPNPVREPKKKGWLGRSVSYSKKMAHSIPVFGPFLRAIF